MYQDATPPEINHIMDAAWNAFEAYRKVSLKQRANFMRTIAKELEALGDEVLQIAHEETHLPEPRLRNERARTIFQLNNYADACERGAWLEARIDKAIPKRNPRQRRMLCHLQQLNKQKENSPRRKRQP